MRTKKPKGHKVHCKCFVCRLGKVTLGLMALLFALPAFAVGEGPAIVFNQYGPGAYGSGGVDIDVDPDFCHAGTGGLTYGEMIFKGNIVDVSPASGSGIYIIRKVPEWYNWYPTPCPTCERFYYVEFATSSEHGPISSGKMLNVSACGDWSIADEHYTEPYTFRQGRFSGLGWPYTEPPNICYWGTESAYASGVNLATWTFEGGPYDEDGCAEEFKPSRPAWGAVKGLFR